MAKSQSGDILNPLPTLYHAHHLSYSEDLPFWLTLSERMGGPILELGCGTGRVLVPLVEAGDQAFGLDRDAGMLNFLRQHLPIELRTRIHLFQADLTAFHLAARFPLILLPCNTYSTLDVSDRAAALRCVKDHLAPGGLFVFSVPNPAILAELEGESDPELETHFHHPQSGNPVQVSSAWEYDGRGYHLRWLYDHLLPDGQVERWTVTSRHFPVSVETHLAEVEAVGLSLDVVYGDFDYSPYELGAPHLIIEVEKD
jgi:SAM-dependent methyltransferase